MNAVSVRNGFVPSLTFVALLLIGCPRAGEERALADLQVGVVAGDGFTISAVDGLAHPRAVTSTTVTWWTSAPVVILTAEAKTAVVQRWTFENCMPSAELVTVSGSGVRIAEVATTSVTQCVFDVEIDARATASLRLAPADFDTVESFRFVVMGDVQTALDSVDDIFMAINAEIGVRFVLSTGDIVETAAEDEYDLYEEQLRTLEVPFYSTIGNHELWSAPERWQQRFGRYSIHFVFKGMRATFVDSGNAGIDPVIYEWLDGWLEEGRGYLHVFGTHFPPIDPVGVRSGSFRSRREAAKLLTRLAAGEIDATFYGHVHTYASFENANIPAYISGGGGAWPERLDGIGRHFLVVDAEPLRDALSQVRVVRVDR